MQAILLLTLPYSVSVLAQTASDVGAIRGTVRDESSAIVTGAKVMLTEESKGLVRSSESDSGGTFLFTSVIAGGYSIRVEKEGFNTEHIQGLRIEVGEQASLTVTLHVGPSHTEITVMAPNATDLHAESNTLGSVVDSGRVRDLPLNGRHFLELAELAAGTSEVSAASGLFSTNVGPPERTIILPGTLPNSVKYYLNGINITGSRDGELALGPSIAAIDQFRVQENFLMPDEGINPALVNIVTKSGGNQFHGEAYEFLRNRVLDARGFFAADRDDVKLNQFGGTVSGALRKNRLWFYGFYEGLRQLTAFSAGGYTPTTAMFGGNFAALGSVIYDPATYGAATNTREPFPDFRIPTNRINPVSRNLLTYYPPGSSLASVPMNISGSPRNTQDDNQGGLRLDAALSSRSQLFGQYFRQHSPSDQPGLFPFSGMLYLNSSDLAMVQHTLSLSSHAVNILRLGFLRNIALGGNEAQDNGPHAAALGILNTFATDGVTAINLQGYSSFGRANGVVGNQDNMWQLDEEFTYSRGAHIFAFGAGMNYRRGWHLNGNASALGTLSFQPVFTAQLTQSAQAQLAPVANTGNSFADFLLGFPVTGMLIGLPVVQFRSKQFTPYFQDSWRLARNLTLNYGLSWFLETPPEPQGWARQFIHGFDFQTGLLAFAALGQSNYNPVPTRKNNLAPRLGLAWKPDFLGGLILRAAAGVYYSEFPWVLAADSVQGPPAGAGQNLSNPQSNPMATYAMGVNIFAPRPTAPLTDTYAASLPPGTTVQALDPNFRTAYASQWNFSLQRSVGLNDSIEVDYLGSSSHQLPNLSDPSQCRPAANLYCDPSTRAYPRYGLVLFADSSGNSSYQSLAAKYEHRSALGLNLRIEYAFSKSLTDTWQSSLNTNQISDCRSCSKGPANFDVRQRAVGSFIWNLPVGRGQRLAANLPRWVDTAVGGWSLSAITTFATGQPVILTAPNQTGSPFINPLPNRICDGRSRRLSESIRTNGMLWFDASCFAVPPAGYFGNSGGTVLNGPGLNDWDLGFQKTFGIARDAAKFQVRTETFNAWNHAQFQQPNGNAGAGVNFGRISATLPPRLVQVALKLGW
jgi:hypothetical protein